VAEGQPPPERPRDDRPVEDPRRPRQVRGRPNERRRHLHVVNDQRRHVAQDDGHKDRVHALELYVGEREDLVATPAVADDLDDGDLEAAAALEGHPLRAGEVLGPHDAGGDGGNAAGWHGLAGRHGNVPIVVHLGAAQLLAPRADDAVPLQVRGGQAVKVDGPMEDVCALAFDRRPQPDAPPEDDGAGLDAPAACMEAAADGQRREPRPERSSVARAARVDVHAGQPRVAADGERARHRGALQVQVPDGKDVEVGEGAAPGDGDALLRGGRGGGGDKGGGHHRRSGGTDAARYESHGPTEPEGRVDEGGRADRAVGKADSRAVGYQEEGGQIGRRTGVCALA